MLDVRNEWLWDIFQSLVTQSRSSGLGGFAGFDYGALPFILQSKGVPESMWSRVLETLEMLTAVGIKFWNKKEDDK